LRDIVCDYVIEHLADDDAVLVVDETGFLKQGKASCGVARRHAPIGDRRPGRHLGLRHGRSSDFRCRPGPKQRPNAFVHEPGWISEGCRPYKGCRLIWRRNTAQELLFHDFCQLRASAGRISFCGAWRVVRRRLKDINLTRARQVKSITTS
jgi:hypothetical protein